MRDTKNLIVIVFVLLFCTEITSRFLSNKIRSCNSDIRRKAQNEMNVPVVQVDSKIPFEELKVLAREYEAYVKLCTEFYGSWANAIKSNSSNHLPDFAGEYLNIESGLRKTIGHSQEASKKLFLFGGSTVFCGEVRDDLTICSQIQALVNQLQIPMNVINFGRSGSTISNRLLYLRGSDISEDDIAVFWFGVNELGWKYLEGKTAIPLWASLLRLGSQVIERLSRYSAMLIWFSKYFDSLILQPLFCLHAARETIKSLEGIEKLAAIKGFRTLIILQPNILTKSNLSSREKVIFEFFSQKKRGKITKKLFRINYPRFARALKPYSGYSATDLFDNVETEVYVDWVHLNSDGNEIVARQILKLLQEDPKIDISERIID